MLEMLQRIGVVFPTVMLSQGGTDSFCQIPPLDDIVGMEKEPFPTISTQHHSGMPITNKFSRAKAYGS